MIDEFEFCRLDRRRQAIVEAARTLFIEQGYERTTLGHIVEHAGGSMATVYKLFGNKDGLLEAVVFEKAASGEALIREAAACGLDPEGTLHRIADALHDKFLDPDGVALVRIVIARSIDDTDFARRFFERTATRTRDALEELFVYWRAKGVPMTGDPETLAEIFLGLFVSDLQTEAISHGAGGQLSPDRLRERTDFFCRGAGFAGAAHPARAQ
ncbi:TetR/AcrR family transcriptional regulator [Pelagerythrobacter sp.]|uniref:TetR/AcrR family transcriptional regulator n=1 Tax=Pelagerythrobacter sp. TaxID=2800702 RepID=UPI0035B2B624